MEDKLTYKKKFEKQRRNKEELKPAEPPKVTPDTYVSGGAIIADNPSFMQKN